MLDDQAGEPVVRLQQPDERLDVEQAAQALHADGGRDADLRIDWLSAVDEMPSV